MVKAIKITILSLLCISLVLFMFMFIENGFKFSNSKVKLVFEESYDINDINKISLIAKSSDINIYESKDDKLNVKVYSEKKDDVKITNENNVFEISNVQKGTICFGFCFADRKINIYVPKSYEGSFKIKTTSGDIKSELATFNDYNISVTSGDIELYNASSLVGSATSGDVEIEEINSSIDFKTTSGDIEIERLTLTKNSMIKVTSGDISIDRANNAYINSSVKSGDIDVKNNDRHAEYELVIKTTSGDIEVN